MSQLTRDQPHLFQELSAGFYSKKKEPVFTHMLRNAHKVMSILCVLWGQRGLHPRVLVVP
jgi:hypothetical protein